MDLSLQDSLSIRSDVVFRQLDEEAVLLDLKSGKYFGLNEAGARIWQLVAEARPLGDILDTLEDEYSSERSILERDLLDLAGELCMRGLVEVKERKG
ncbi:MAG TPA: PqqD family protein [Vicinamibacterales bacterium]|nr:PqqD family protein [Vicinamibacterales bacterium]